MQKPTYSEVNRSVLRPLGLPPFIHYPIFLILGAVILNAAGVWLFQILEGMGVAGYRRVVDWGVYISNYIFWVGMAMSGTMISAALYLLRAGFRRAVNRAAETMTLFAILVAGLFPLSHLGRLWVAYYILPYPSQRQIWPNFSSPLVWDMASITVYMIVSYIFYFAGVIPDAAAARDYSAETAGPDGIRTRIYSYLSMGWSGSSSQWHHHNRSYLFIAALITPVAISVHSIVGWDFGTSILPGWHSTIYAPYFVAGAILSGMAMALTMLIPLRYFLHLENIITIDHLDNIAKIMIIMGLLLAYTYGIEPFFAWYSGDPFEWQFYMWKSTGWIAPWHWILIPLNVINPALLLIRKLRRTPVYLFISVILVNIGMWTERYVIVASATAHDYMPHNWGAYGPNWVEACITAGGFSLFFFGVLTLSKQLPMVALNEVKEGLEPEPETQKTFSNPARMATGSEPGLMAVYSSPSKLLAAVEKARERGLDGLETFTPFRVKAVEKVIGMETSPVRFWTFAGTVGGAFGIMAAMVFAAKANNLIVGGKPPFSPIAFVIFAFEAGVAIGATFNLIGMLFHSRLNGSPLPAAYDRRFSRDKFGLFVSCKQKDMDAVTKILHETEGVEEVNAISK